jgi:NAD+ synthase
MSIQEKIAYMVNWLRSYAEKSKTKGFVVGVSGGIDSAVTSTLCAMTGLPLLVVEMPIYQAQSQVNRAQEHMAWLKSKWSSVRSERVELTSTFDTLIAALPTAQNEELLHLSLANTRARLRMTTLYYFAGVHRYLVAGTGNKVEDFGVGFYTKYGDGGVDLSPIADLYKTEVYAVAKELGIVSSIQQAAPTDGLWGDDRTDEDQIGASYPELEWAMEWIANFEHTNKKPWDASSADQLDLNDRQKYVLKLYWRMHKANEHKMVPIPVCLFPTA